jgi:hypothetical protein
MINDAVHKVGSASDVLAAAPPATEPKIRDALDTM